MTSTRLSGSSGFAVLAATAALVASFLPWASSGARARSSYQLAQAAVRLDVVAPGWEPVVVAWFLLPALVGCAWVAWGCGRPRVSSTLCALAGGLCAMAALLTITSPLVVEAGAPLALGSGALAVAAAVLHLVRTRSAR